MGIRWVPAPLKVKYKAKASICTCNVRSFVSLPDSIQFTIYAHLSCSIAIIIYFYFRLCCSKLFVSRIFFPFFYIFPPMCERHFFFLGSSWNLFRCRTNCYCACVVVPHFCSPSVIDGILALCVLHEPHSSDAKLNENDEQTKLAGMLCYIHYIRSSIPAVCILLRLFFDTGGLHPRERCQNGNGNQTNKKWQPMIDANVFAVLNKSRSLERILKIIEMEQRV